jgi:predicted O-methyltransferase YrrM
MRLLWRATGRRQSVDAFCTSLLKGRRHLTVLEAKTCIPQFEESEIRLRRCPVGAWSTPLIDVFVLLKAAVGFGSKRVLELGSYRGDTARLLAENTADDVRICAVDVHADHGVSYRDTAVAARIERRVGKIAPSLFPAGERYDFIFVDADHDYGSVMNDTAVALQLLSERGVIFWHDYHFHSYFHGMAGVPEALKHYAKEHAIVSLDGTTLGMCSRHPGWETAKLLVPQTGGRSGQGDVWRETRMRG